MSRKHFQMLADKIAKMHNVHERIAAANAVADACAEANPRFKRQRFLEACNVLEPVTVC